MKEKYDYIIVGSGVTGNICTFELQKKSYFCFIVEKARVIIGVKRFMEVEYYTRH